MFFFLHSLSLSLSLSVSLTEKGWYVRVISVPRLLFLWWTRAERNGNRFLPFWNSQRNNHKNFPALLHAALHSGASCSFNTQDIFPETQLTTFLLTCHPSASPLCPRQGVLHFSTPAAFRLTRGEVPQRGNVPWIMENVSLYWTEKVFGYRNAPRRSQTLAS